MCGCVDIPFEAIPFATRWLRRYANINRFTLFRDNDMLSDKMRRNHWSLIQRKLDNGTL